MSDQEFLSDFERESFPASPNRPAMDARCGIFANCDLEAYFADPIEEGSLSQSGIKVLLEKTPLEFAFQHPRLNDQLPPDKAATAAHIRRGDVVHQLALGKGSGFVIGEYPDFRTKAAQEWKAQCIKDGATPVLAHEFEKAEIMAEVVRDRISQVLDGAAYETEVAIIWEEDTPFGKILMRGLLDVWCPERFIILDPKCTDRLHDGRPGKELVARHAVDMGWDRQGALYCRGISRLIPEADGKVRFGNLMQATEEPFVNRLLWHSTTMRVTALAECRPAMATFAECMANGRWPSFPAEGETLELPSWEENRRMEAEIKAHG